jgi:hypothetical protein
MHASLLFQQIVPILRAGLAFTEHVTSILPSATTFHLGQQDFFFANNNAKASILVSKVARNFVYDHHTYVFAQTSEYPSKPPRSTNAVVMQMLYPTFWSFFSHQNCTLRCRAFTYFDLLFTSNNSSYIFSFMYH